MPGICSRIMSRKSNTKSPFKIAYFLGIRGLITSSYVVQDYATIGVGRVAQSVQRLAMGWTVRGSNPGGGKIFHTCPDWPWGPPSLLYSGYRVFPGGKEQLGRDADPSPPSSAMVKKGQSYTSTDTMGRTACTESQCIYKGALYLYLFMPLLDIWSCRVYLYFI